MDIETQIGLEELFNKNETLPRLREEFRNSGVLKVIGEAELNPAPALDLLCQMVLHKRASPKVLIPILAPKYFGQSDQDLQNCADFIVECINAGLVLWDPNRFEVVIYYGVTDEVQEDLDRYQYPLPLVIEPKEVRGNHESGYYRTKAPLVLNSGVVGGDLCLDHINRVNRTKLSVNMDIVNQTQNHWKGVNTHQPGETGVQFRQKQLNFKDYNKTSREVIEHLFMLGNEFYLTHRYDKRGRTYAQGYHVNPQGNDWNKACIEFAHKEVTE